MASNMSVPIVLGPSLDKGKWRDGAASRSNFISVKYNLRPPSIGSSAPGYLHSPSKYDSHWLLEYDASGADENQHGSHSSVHGFIGAQTVAKDVDCVLVWDERKQCYILDRLASSFTFRIDRSHNKLTERAKTGLSMIDRSSSDRNQSSALGLNLSGVNDSTADAETNLDEDMADNEDFARELELGLEHISHDDEGKAKNSSEEGSEPLPTSQKLRTGLGLIDSSMLRDDVITPRGSPYIDRPKSISDKWGGTKPDHTPSQSHISFSASHAPTRSTPVVSPTSVANSPRMTGLDSTLSSSNTWKPPPQRSNVAIAYDEEEEESDDEEEDEDEEDEEEEEGEDDDDLDDYARQLESSLQS